MLGKVFPTKVSWTYSPCCVLGVLLFWSQCSEVRFIWNRLLCLDRSRGQARRPALPVLPARSSALVAAETTGSASVRSPAVLAILCVGGPILSQFLQLNILVLLRGRLTSLLLTCVSVGFGLHARVHIRSTLSVPTKRGEVWVGFMFGVQVS